MQQGHVLGAIERQPLGAVVMHHLWDAGEHAAALVQGVAILLGLGHNDVDTALARPGSHTGNMTPGDEILSCFLHNFRFGPQSLNYSCRTRKKNMRKCFIVHLMYLKTNKYNTNHLGYGLEKEGLFSICFSLYVTNVFR